MSETIPPLSHTS